jgi:tetratricopeptide (TPR) repeat protein
MRDRTRSPKTFPARAPARALALLGVALALAVGCGGAMPASSVPASVGALRADAKSSGDGEVVGRWALAEMLAPGGDGAHAREARKRLGEIKGRGLYASLGRALWDETHGQPKGAAEAYVSVLEATRTSDDPDAGLFGWFATRHLLGLRGSVPELYKAHATAVESLVAKPGAIGWRAVADLREWSVAEAFDRAESTGDAYEALVVERMGCSPALRIAGPFGRGAASDRRQTFAAERPGPWPSEWVKDPVRGSVPHVLKTERHRCLTASTERTEDGVFYLETFFTTTSPRDLIVAAQGSVKVWVDDAPVVERDLREWGVWQRFGAQVRVGAGRHRVLARTLNDAGSVRVLEPDGTPAKVAFDVDAQRPYALVPPTLLASPNALDAIVRARKVASPLLALLAGYGAHAESMDDVAAVLFEPYVSPTDAAPLMLMAAGMYTRSDPALPADVRHLREKDLHQRAAARDDLLWYSRAWLILDQAEQKGAVDAVEPLRRLAEQFPDEPEVLEQLARLYSRLGWRGERMQALAALAKRFPDHIDGLRMYMAALDEDGPVREADAIAARIHKLDPDAEVDLARALAREDWKRAVEELQRLGKRRPDRKEIAGRIADVLERSGDPRAAAKQLDEALSKNPEDSGLRLRLADRAYAKGDAGALRRALADALQAGGKGAELREAIDLLEGATHLEPYRIDGRKVIAEFEAWEKQGKRMEGNAARVLDYSALWVHPDGSSEMLEHEIMRIQSQEVITKESEQQPPSGLVLRMRVIKPDGKVLEPEPVEGKPTLTVPHLEVGDYLEIEHITPQGGDGRRGLRYRGPTWFFREADKGYWRSEFVTLTPKDRPVEVETRGKVPPPKTREKGTFLERRWRVDESPPAPQEPEAPDPREFLPSVRLGWGITLEDSIARLVDAAADETPLDPRLYAKAMEIVGTTPAARSDERARKVYKWLAENVQDGQESDGRRAILGKTGSRQMAFFHLMRQLAIPVELALVKDRLAMPPIGKMSEVETWAGLLLRLDTDKGVRWMVARDKFAPFGYVPAELRGQPAYRLVAGAPKDAVPSAGDLDGIRFEGRADMRDDGSATVDVTLRYSGKLAIGMRNVFDRVPEQQLRDFVESRILARNIPGARARTVELENKADVGEPLGIRVKADVPQLVRAQGGRVVLKSLFSLRLAQLATLPERQTPVFLGSSSHVEVKFQIVVPESWKMPASLPAGELKDGDRTARVADTVQGHALTLDRLVDIPAGRVQPGAEYAAFQRFAQEADTLVEREIVLGK